MASVILPFETVILTCTLPYPTFTESPVKLPVTPAGAACTGSEFELLFEELEEFELLVLLFDVVFELEVVPLLVTFFEVVVLFLAVVELLEELLVVDPDAEPLAELLLF